MSLVLDAVKSSSLSTTKLLCAGATGTINQFPTTDGTGIISWTSPLALSQTLYVAKNGNDTTGNGSMNWPYATIQKALDQITAATDSATARLNWVVSVGSGTYDEALSVDIGRKKVTLVCDTGVSIGTFGSSNWAPSGTARDITVTCSLTNIDSIRASFAIVSRAAGEAGTHQAYGNHVRVSGSLIVSNSTGGSSGEVYLKGVALFGWDGVAAGNAASLAAAGWAGNLNVYMDSVRCYGQITGSVVRLQRANGCRFDKAIAVATYSNITGSQLAAGMTWTVAASEVPPIGVFNSTLVGTFSALSLYVDSFSHNSYVANGATGAILVPLSRSAEGTYVLTGNYSIPTSGYASVYLGNPDTVDWTVTLPALGTTTKGATITFINESASNNLIIQAAGSDHINNASTTNVTLSGQYARMRLCGGTSVWHAC